MHDALGASVLEEPLRAATQEFVALRGDDAAAARIDGPALVGLARALATQPKMASFLSHRPGWLERVADLSGEALRRRESELLEDGDAIRAADLEDALDLLRLRRREEMAYAACADLGDVAPFETISDYLSVLAETTTRLTLDLAREAVGQSLPFSVIGMGKIAGREFTYHSDLDVIFLYDGGAEQVAGASRLAQRLISFLTTMTGAGVAYDVDTRLRPSGRQGMLVTSYRGFETYQTRSAETWEHLAMLRSRPIAGEREDAGELLARVRRQVCGSSTPWAELAALRARVVEERASDREDAVALKTGRGGLMDVDFLAGGGLLEWGFDSYPALPSVAAMLATWATEEFCGPIVTDYRTLRVVEARARWIAGRGVETLEPGSQALDWTAALLAEAADAGALLDRVAAARSRIRAGYDAIVAEGSVAGHAQKAARSH
jgi:glutamate-ammonia-ligase adenylyltransferase